MNDPEKMFVEAMKIHACCIDKDISDEDSRLYSYIHFKIMDSMNPLYFFESHEEDRDSLLVMLGDENAVERFKNKSTPEFLQENPEYEESCEHILNLCDMLKELDKKLREECGLENRIMSELKYRLKLYTDTEFCRQKVDYYFRNILTDLPMYTEDKIQEAFDKAKKKNEDIDKLLSEIEGATND